MQFSLPGWIEFTDKYFDETPANYIDESPTKYFNESPGNRLSTVKNVAYISYFLLI